MLRFSHKLFQLFFKISGLGSCDIIGVLVNKNFSLKIVFFLTIFLKKLLLFVWEKELGTNRQTYYLFTSIDSRTLLVALRTINKIPRINVGKIWHILPVDK